MIKLIKINLKSKDGYINKYNKDILSYELGNYILEETKGIPIKDKLRFIVSNDFTMSEGEKNEMVDMIRNNFGNDISEIMQLYKKQTLANSLIFIVGLLLLILYPLLTEIVLSEFVLIFCWLLIGEAICNFFYNGIEYHHKVARRKQIVNAKILFDKKNKI